MPCFSSLTFDLVYIDFDQSLKEIKLQITSGKWFKNFRLGYENFYGVVFLAVQNSSIGDLVTH